MAKPIGAEGDSEATTASRALVVFVLDDQRYALPLDRVQRALRVVAITPLPSAPSIVLGVVDLGGEVLPVVDLRRRFGLPPREVRLADHLLVASTGHRTVTLLVDDTQGAIAAPPERCARAGEILPGLALLEGVVKLDDGLILIHDLGRLLSLDEESALARALDTAGGVS